MSEYLCSLLIYVLGERVYLRHSIVSLINKSEHIFEDISMKVFLCTGLQPNYLPTDLNSSIQLGSCQGQNTTFNNIIK